MKPKLPDLTPLQRCFVEEYLIDLKGAAALRRAGYKERAAASRASKLLRKPAVAAAVKKAMEKRSHRTQIAADRVLREYARIAFADIRDLTEVKDEALQVKALDDLSADDAAAIAELTIDGKGKGTKIKLHDKKRALDAIARHLGLFGKRQEPGGESPAATAERVRGLIRSRLAHLGRSEDEG